MKNTKQKIMVIEDDPTYLSFWKRFLELLGFEMIAATSYEEALTKCISANCKLAICDVVLPGKTGYQLLDMLAKTNPSLPVIITTAYNTQLSRFKFSPRKFHLLHKPFTGLDQLRKLIMHLVSNEDVYMDADEDSFAPNDEFPEVTEWHL